MTLEEHFETIETIIDKMETGEVTLDESFALYQAGLEQIKEANAMLDNMEKAMLMMSEDGEEVEEF